MIGLMISISRQTRWTPQAETFETLLMLLVFEVVYLPHSDKSVPKAVCMVNVLSILKRWVCGAKRNQVKR